ncbi:hypothetical protein I0C86_14775 [Plantactinospora sp. S1510]|uniref:Uncharacterized protein n=1 Tax=Plantactinospora alkalitolerans TaxID=2789879 RepID=A0ABS0GW95_9ACTN|nr:hypothetical protein [Plantactinospora alkalitolerans]MBF9130209.1 hypothetical protein [Plantactinospora alkalitolerans]
MTIEVSRYVIHLPIVTTDLVRARVLARTAARALTFLCVDAQETTVSEEHNPDVRHRVFCPRRLPDGRRCGLRIDHDVPCTRRRVRRRSI